MSSISVALSDLFIHTLFPSTIVSTLYKVATPIRIFIGFPLAVRTLSDISSYIFHSQEPIHYSSLCNSNGLQIGDWLSASKQLPIQDPSKSKHFLIPLYQLPIQVEIFLKT